MNKQSAEALALAVMVKYGLRDWKFGFSQSRNKAGTCWYGPKIIQLSEHFVELNDLDRVLDTIKHEVAHALVGWKAAHGPTWKKVAVAIGCSGERCWSHRDTNMPQRKRWVGTCPKCSKTFVRYGHVRPKSTLTYWCYCQVALEWRETK
jgi:predicted SprT family Zn-dependent metalloprotease